MTNYQRIASNQEKREQWSDRSQNQQEILSPSPFPITLFSPQNIDNKKSNAALNFMQIIFYIIQTFL